MGRPGRIYTRLGCHASHDREREQLADMKCWLPLKTMAAAIALTALPMTAAAICPHTSVKGLDGKCLDGRCPPGSTAYMATIENSFPDQVYITYAFRRPCL